MFRNKCLGLLSKRNTLLSVPNHTARCSSHKKLSLTATSQKHELVRPRTLSPLQSNQRRSSFSQAKDYDLEKITILQSSPIADKVKLFHSNSPQRECANSTSNVTNLGKMGPQMTSQKRPLTVLIAWTEAKEKHVAKYRELYLNRGIDVLTVATRLFDPIFAQREYKKVAQSLADILLIQEEYDTIIFHLFSQGFSQYADMLRNIKRRANGDTMLEHIKTRVHGVILDSPSMVDPSPIGLSLALFPHNKPLRDIVQWLLAGYLIKGLTRASRYLRAVEQFAIEHPLPVPHLILTSEVDPVANPKMLAPLLSVWSGGRVSFEMKVWPDSPHVAHIQRYPQEYEELIQKFLTNIGVFHDGKPDQKSNPL